MLKVFPGDKIHGVTEGSKAHFFVEAHSNPAANFQWRYMSENGTFINIPSKSYDNFSNLTIFNITDEDFGNYSVSAHNEIGQWEDVIFELRALGM